MANDSRIVAAINEEKQIVNNFSKDINKISNDVRDINKIMKVEEDKTKCQNKSKVFLKNNFINIISLLVAVVALYTSYEIGINNSALNFTYKTVDIKKVSFKDRVEFEVREEEIIRGGAKIDLKVDVISGQISSLYLIYKKNGKFVFELLNNGEIQDKRSGDKSYKTDSYFDMEKRAEINGVQMGMGQLYILSENLNGQVSIDTIQITGPIIQETIGDIQQVYDNDIEYGFRYLKNNKLITLSDNNNEDEGWVNLTDSYPDVLKETNIEKIEDDIAIIKEKYSRYKY